MPFEVPWLATVKDGKLHLRDKAGYDAWLLAQFGAAEGEPAPRAMVLVLPLVADSPAYHAAAYRYYWSAVLPIIAEDMGEANLEAAHDALCRQFLPPALVPKKRGGLKVKRKSASMESLTCAQFCDFLDRVIVDAQTDRGLLIPMADPAWKWKQSREREALSA